MLHILVASLGFVLATSSLVPNAMMGGSKGAAGTHCGVSLALMIFIKPSNVAFSPEIAWESCLDSSVRGVRGVEEGGRGVGGMYHEEERREESLR